MNKSSQTVIFIAVMACLCPAAVPSAFAGDYPDMAQPQAPAPVLSPYGLREQLAQLERTVFGGTFEQDALTARVARLGARVLPAEVNSLSSLSLPQQIERISTALKFAAPGAAVDSGAAADSGAAPFSSEPALGQIKPFTPGPSVGQVPVGQIPFGQVPVGQVPFGQIPVGQVPFGQVPVGQSAALGPRSGQARVADQSNTINQRIVDYVYKHMGQQVGNGECWTLAASAMDEAGAREPQGYDFGRELSENEDWQPGDIIQFTSCVFKQSLPGGGWQIFQAGSPNHTAVFLGRRDGKVLIGQQNVLGNRTVSTMLLDFKSLMSGKYKVFRAVAEQ